MLKLVIAIARTPTPNPASNIHQVSPSTQSQFRYQRLFSDRASAVWTVREFGQDELIRAAFVENVGKNPVERKLRFIRPTALAACNSRFSLVNFKRSHRN